MNTKTATPLGRKLFAAFAIGTTGLFAGCNSCYHGRHDCPYGYDTRPPLYDTIVFGWLPDCLTLRRSTHDQGHVEHAHYHAGSSDHVILETDAETAPLADEEGAPTPAPDMPNP